MRVVFLDGDLFVKLSIKSLKRLLSFLCKTHARVIIVIEDKSIKENPHIQKMIKDSKEAFPMLCILDTMRIHIPQKYCILEWLEDYSKIAEVENIAILSNNFNTASLEVQHLHKYVVKLPKDIFNRKKKRELMRVLNMKYVNVFSAPQECVRYKF